MSATQATQTAKPIPHDQRDERPKALRYRDKTDAIVTIILDALPKIIGKLISMAEEGDVRASRYLVDRIFGRTARVPLPPNLNTALPYGFSDWTCDLLRHKDTRDTKAHAYMRSIRTAASIPGIGCAIEDNPSMETIRKDLARWQMMDNKRKHKWSVN